MGFILILAVAFVIWQMIGSTKNLDNTSDLVVAVKQCPPHKWSYVEVKDTEGNIVKHRLVCALCGPMVTDNGPRNNGDYS